MSTTSKGPQGSDPFDDGVPVGDDAPAPAPVQVPIKENENFWQENRSNIVFTVLIIILLLLLMFLGGMLFKSDDKLDQATDQLNTASAEFLQAAKAATASTEGGIQIDMPSYFQSQRAEIKAFFLEIFKELGLGQNGGGGKVTYKVNLTGEQAQLIADVVANRVKAGGNPEELQRLREVNGDLATTTEKQGRAIKSLELDKSKLKEEKAKLEGQLATQPAPTLVIPEDAEGKARAEKLAAEDKARAEKLAAESRERSEKMDKKMDRILQGQDTITEGQRLNQDQVDKLVADAKDIAGQEEAAAIAKTCPEGTSVPFVKPDRPFKWYLIMNPSEYAELKSASLAERDAVEAKYSGKMDALVDGIFIPTCINIAEYYMLIDQADGNSVVTLKWDGEELKAATINHRILVMFLFAKGGPIIEMLGDQNVDLSMGNDYPLLRGQGN